MRNIDSFQPLVYFQELITPTKSSQKLVMLFVLNKIRVHLQYKLLSKTAPYFVTNNTELSFKKKLMFYILP